MGIADAVLARCQARGLSRALDPTKPALAAGTSLFAMAKPTADHDIQQRTEGGIAALLKATRDVTPAPNFPTALRARWRSSASAHGDRSRHRRQLGSS